MQVSWSNSKITVHLHNEMIKSRKYIRTISAYLNNLILFHCSFVCLSSQKTQETQYLQQKSLLIQNQVAISPCQNNILFANGVVPILSIKMFSSIFRNVCLLLQPLYRSKYSIERTLLVWHPSVLTISVMKENGCLLLLIICLFMGPNGYLFQV